MAPKTATKAAAKKVVPVEEPIIKEVVEDVAAEESDGSTDSKKSRKVTNAVPDSLVKLVKANLPTEIQDLKLTQKSIKAICESFVKTMITEVKNGNNITLTNHMTFKRVLRNDRTHKNPKTGEEIFKPAHYVMTMDVKPALKKHFAELEVEAAEEAEVNDNDGTEDGAVEDVEDDE
jgi:nucleoid DNA-binding protein